MNPVHLGDPGFGLCLRLGADGIHVDASWHDGGAPLTTAELVAMDALIREALSRTPPCRTCGCVPMTEAELREELADARRYGDAAERPPRCRDCGWPARLETPRGPSPIDEEGF